MWNVFPDSVSGSPCDCQLMQRTIFLESSIPSGSYTLFASSFSGFSELWREGFGGQSYVELSIPKTLCVCVCLFLCIPVSLSLSSCVSEFCLAIGLNSFCCRRKFL